MRRLPSSEVMSVLEEERVMRVIGGALLVVPDKVKL